MGVRIGWFKERSIFITKIPVKGWVASIYCMSSLDGKGRYGMGFFTTSVSNRISDLRFVTNMPLLEILFGDKQ